MKFSKHKTILVITGFVSSSNFLFAQVTVSETVAPVKKDFFDKFPDYIQNPWIWFGILMVGVLSMVFFALTKAVFVLSKQLNGIHVKEETVTTVHAVKNISSWKKLMERMTKSVPVEHEADVMLDHNYDGIRELDNQLPPWWKWGFYFTIAFAVFYLFSYHVIGTGKLSLQEYADEMKQAQNEKEERMKIAANNITDANVIAFTDDAHIAEGKNIFEKNCVACHGNFAQGNVGPNLTDKYWLHGGGIKNIFHTITEGVPNKGMISWKTQLAPKQIQEVASFVLTLSGTNPPGAKEPQGDLWIEETTKDSSSTSISDSTLHNISGAKKL